MSKTVSLEFTAEQVDLLAKLGALQIATSQKNNPGSTSLATTPGLHGPRQGGLGYGLFSSPGVRPEMFTSFARPYSAMSVVSINRSEYSDELLEIMTGVTASSDENASGFCDVNAPKAGTAKKAKVKYQWGDWLAKTNLNAVPLIGQLRNRADVVRRVLNAGPGANPLMPDVLYRFPDDSRDQLQYELFLLGTELERSLEIVCVRGARSTTGAARRWGWITEFNGITQLIKTGYVDEDTNVLAPALDSAVISFNANISGTMADGRNIMQAISDLVYGLQQRADVTNLRGTQWAFWGRPELHRALARVISCQYYVNTCGFTGSSDGNRQDVESTRQLYDDMLTGGYLLVEGMRIPYLYTEGLLQETTANNVYLSDLLYVPYDWGGTPLVRLEYFDMANPYTQKYANFAGQTMEIINDGMYLVGRAQTPMCLEYHFAARMRLILETPWLAGRLDSLQYSFMAPIRTALPGASFYADGGVSYVWS